MTAIVGRGRARPVVIAATWLRPVWPGPAPPPVPVGLAAGVPAHTHQFGLGGSLVLSAGNFEDRVDVNCCYPSARTQGALQPCSAVRPGSPQWSAQQRDLLGQAGGPGQAMRWSKLESRSKAPHLDEWDVFLLGVGPGPPPSPVRQDPPGQGAGPTLALHSRYEHCMLAAFGADLARVPIVGPGTGSPGPGGPGPCSKCTSLFELAAGRLSWAEQPEDPGPRWCRPGC